MNSAAGGAAAAAFAMAHGVKRPLGQIERRLAQQSGGGALSFPLLSCD
jgi:hypothetical protein